MRKIVGWCLLLIISAFLITACGGGGGSSSSGSGGAQYAGTYYGVLAVCVSDGRNTGCQDAQTSLTI